MFTARQWDGESNLYYYRARYYDPSLGRFLQADPVGYYAGDTNLYRYCWNNPTNFIDPYGFSPLGSIAKKTIKWASKKIGEEIATEAVKKVIEKLLNIDLPPLSPEDIFLEPDEIDEGGENDMDGNGQPDFLDDWDNDGVPNWEDDSDGDGIKDIDDEDLKDNRKKKDDQEGKWRR